jgi:cell wall-associated NlpC family hydrolase
LSKQYPTEEFHQDIVPPQKTRPANFRRKSNILSVAVSALVIPGLLATVALPAYGAATSSTGAERASIAQQRDVTEDAQKLHVVATADATAIPARDSFGVVAPPAAVGSGRPFGSLMTNPPLPGFNLAGVAGVAGRYLGVPYVLGGESPSGFDCSGLVAYVYAQFGIRLPHSSSAQARIGTRIARSAALPGDVVVMDGGSHVGIYVGGGRMIHAPKPGRAVSVEAIYDSNYYFVRFGI